MIPEGTRLKLKLILLEANMQLTYRGFQYNATTPSPSDIPTTNLKYRGASYRRSQTARAEATSAVLTYRGTSYTLNSAATDEIAADVPPTTLKYRGASYRRSQTAMVEATNAVLTSRGTSYTFNPATETVVVEQPAEASVQDKARLLSIKQHREIRNRQQTMLQRAAASLGFDVNVADYWHHVQGKIPTAAWQICDRSSAAMS